jgi:hypothetical protein
MGLPTPPEILLPDAMRAPDVSPSSAQSELERRELDREGPILDPRNGDAEDDVSSPKQKSLLAIAGSLLAEISLTKLLLAWIASIVLPASILGLAPLIVTAWVGGVFSRVLELYGYGAALLLLVIVAVGWFGWRPLFRVAEANFWAILEATRRCGAGALAGKKLRGCRTPARRSSGVGRKHCMASHAVDRIDR